MRCIGIGLPIRTALMVMRFGHFGQVLGRGSFGVVFRAEYRGTPVAVKRLLPANVPKAK